MISTRIKPKILVNAAFKSQSMKLELSHQDMMNLGYLPVREKGKIIYYLTRNK